MTGTVLLVEDSGFFRRAMQMSLEGEGFTVNTAQNGDEAFQLASSTRPDIIVLDMMMPKLNGMTFLRMLKGNTSTAEIPVLVLSGHYDEKDRKTARALGAVEYCNKTATEFRDLVMSIRKALLHSPLALRTSGGTA